MSPSGDGARQGHNIRGSERAYNPEAPRGHEYFDRLGNKKVEVPLSRSLSEGWIKTHLLAMGVGGWT